MTAQPDSIKAAVYANGDLIVPTQYDDCSNPIQPSHAPQQRLYQTIPASHAGDARSFPAKAARS